MVQSNLKVRCDLTNPYARYGLEHFIKKYNFAYSIGRENADIYIGYTQDCNSRVQILLSSDAQDGVCYLNITGETIPIFKKPTETTGERALGITICGNEKSACISLHNDKILVGFDIFEEIGRILDGYYDNLFLKKDELGTKLKAIPVVDVMEDALFSAISQIRPDPGSLHRFTWPDNRKFALVLTHDVDRIFKTFQYPYYMLKSVKKVNLSELGYHLNNLFFKHGKNNPYWTFESICKLENDLGVKSTYYFLNEKGKLNPFSLRSWILFRGVYDIESPPVKETIRRLHEMGFEIGVHGSYNSFNNLNLLQSEKRTLESITGSEAIGTRQHYLNYDNNITPDLHYKAGFKYDTSIGFNPGIGVGFKRGTSFPFQVMLSDGSISTLLEIPLLIMDGALDAAAKLGDCFKLMDQVEKYGGVLTILWHTNRFNSRDYPGMVDLYMSIVNEAKARGAWIARADEVYEWMMKSNKNATVRTECAR